MAVVPAGGCWTDIPYDPAADGELDREKPGTTDIAADWPEEDSPLGDSVIAEEPAEPAIPENTAPDDMSIDAADTDDDSADLFGEEVASLFPDAEPTASELSPQSMPAPEAVPEEDSTYASPVAEVTEPSDEGEQDLFEDIFGEAATTAESDAVPEPAPTSARGDEATTAPLLPWEVGDTSHVQAPLSEGEASQPTQDSEALLPWEETRGDAQPPPEPESANEIPTFDSQPTVELTPAAPVDSRQLTWQLSSRLSYLLLAPDADAASASRELRPIAEVLEIELPAMESTSDMNEADRMRNALAVGREFGRSVGGKYGADHAALVEVAFKSNLLLAVAESRPQLKHSINSTVAAAAVRAGVPESVWQPWQSRIAESDSASEMADAVVDLHTQLGDYLEQLATGDQPIESPVLR